MANSPDRMSTSDVTITERQLLQSVVEVARGVFGAAAASVFMVDAETAELVFEAVSGEGQGHLPGRRFPGGTGIAGWVVACGQPMLTDDVDNVAQFARDAAESTGYVPRGIMAAPLIHNGECIGVLEVLDPGSSERQELEDIDLLGLLATQAALGLEVLARLKWLSGEEDAGGDISVEIPAFSQLHRIATRLPVADELTAGTVHRLLVLADELLVGAEPGRHS